MVQEKGWVDQRVILWWVKEILIPHTEKDSTLLLNSFWVHITNGVKKSNVVAAVIHGGCTSKIQPLDVSINKPFKAELRKCWTAYMLNAVTTAVEKKEKNKAASIPPSKLLYYSALFYIKSIIAMLRILMSSVFSLTLQIWCTRYF